MTRNMRTFSEEHFIIKNTDQIIRSHNWVNRRVGGSDEQKASFSMEKACANRVPTGLRH